MSQTSELNGDKMAAIVVTHNRKALLTICVKALLDQSLPCDIIVVDNASTDGTEAHLLAEGFFDDDRLHYLRLEENFGGAGGFHYGLKYAMLHGWTWFWLMDDDAEPDHSALKNLVRSARDSRTIYASAPVAIENGTKRLCWTMTAIDRPKQVQIKYYKFLQDLEAVERIPFLGLFMHRDMIHLVGLPDPDFFIYHDDNDYCERARKRGVNFVLVKDSIIMHPLQKMNMYPFLNRKIHYRSMPPWKIYYDVRNAICVAKRHYPALLWSKTIPNIFLRFSYSLFLEKNALPILRAYAVGILHGLLNKGGKRLVP